MNPDEPKRSPSPCHCLNLRRAAQAMTALYDERLRPSGLSLAQFSLLRHIRRLEPVNVSLLAEAIRLDRTTLVRNLKPLEDRGLVRDLARQPKRDRQLSLTPEGLDRYREAERHWRQAQTAISTAVGPEDLARLEDLLQRIERLRP